MISGSQGHKATHHPPPRIGHQHRCGSSHRRFRQEVYYTDGGHSTHYLGSDDDVQRYKATMILLELATIHLKKKINLNPLFTLQHLKNPVLRPPHPLLPS